MATASPNNHSTTRELILMLGPTLNLLIDPITIKDNTSKTIANIKKQTAHTNAIEDDEAMYFNMCENFRAKIPNSKPIPIFSFG